MRRLITIIAFLSIATISIAAETEFFDQLSFQDALSMGKMKGKPVLIKLHADWCHFCNRMDKETFSSKLVQEALEDFIVIKVDVDTIEGRELAHQYQVTGIPVILSFNPDGKLVYRQAGYQAPKIFLNTITDLKSAYEDTN